MVIVSDFLDPGTPYKLPKWTIFPSGPQATRVDLPNIKPESIKFPSLPFVMDFDNSTLAYFLNCLNGLGSITGVEKLGRD